MKLNNKGFAITSIIYGIMILFSLIMVALLGMLVSRNTRKEKLVINTESKIDYYNYTKNEELNCSDDYIPPYTGKYIFSKNGSDYSVYLEKKKTYQLKECEVATLKKITTTEQNNIDTTGANEPELLDGLIPIRYDDSGNVYLADSGNTDSNNEWYDYNTRKWANAITINNVTKAVDLSVNGKNGTYEGNGKLENNYYKIDKNNMGYINIDYNNSSSSSGETYILEFLIPDPGESFPYDGLNGGFLIGNLTATPNAGSRLYYKKEDDKLNLYYNAGNNSVCSQEIEYNTVYKIIATANNNNILKIYFNNNKNRSCSNDNSISFNSTNNFTIGKMVFSNQNKMQSYVNIYDAYYINSDLSNDDIESYYNNGYINTNDIAFHYNFESFKPIGMRIGKDAIDTTYVWIPRFKYEVTNINKEKKNSLPSSNINITFERGTSSTGQIICNQETNGVEHCRGKNNEYYTHPAFKDANGKEITGFWVGKYEVSDEDNNIKIKKNENSYLTNKNLLEFSTKLKSMTNKNNIYGFNSSTTDSRIITNLEWGAVGYLSTRDYSGDEAYAVKNMGNDNDYKEYTTGIMINTSGTTLFMGTSDNSVYFAMGTQKYDKYPYKDQFKTSDNLLGDGIAEFAYKDNENLNGSLLQYNSNNEQFDSVYVRGGSNNIFEYDGMDGTAKNNVTTRAVLNKIGDD